MELKDQTAIETGLFVRWIHDVPGEGKGAKSTEAFSNTTKSLEIDGITYTPLDQVVNITSSTSSIRSSSDRVTITLTGITQGAGAPTANTPGTIISRLLNRNIVRAPNSKIIIHRAFFDLETGALLNLPQNPIRRFTGFVNNFNLVESKDPLTNESVIAYQLNCVSYAEFLNRKISGRTTGGDFAEFDSSGSLIGVDRIFQRTARLKGFTLNWGG